MILPLVAHNISQHIFIDSASTNINGDIFVLVLDC